jgi:hypothetical protein
MRLRYRGNQFDNEEGTMTSPEGNMSKPKLILDRDNHWLQTVVETVEIDDSELRGATQSVVISEHDTDGKLIVRSPIVASSTDTKQ